MRDLVGKLAGAVLILAVQTPSHAQQGTVTGQIVEASTGEPLPAVVVTIPEAGRKATTSRGGRFRIERIPAGTRVVKAHREGYRAQGRAVSVPIGGTAEVQLTLQPEPSPRQNESSQDEQEGGNPGRLRPPRSPERTAPVEGKGPCEPYRLHHYFRDGDECKNAVGDYSINETDLGNSITNTYSAIGTSGGMGFVDYEWDLPKNPGPVRLRIRGAVKNTATGDMEINIWNGSDYVTVAKKRNANFERYKYSTIGLHVKDDRLTSGGYFAVQIVTDDGWWIDDVRADWTDSSPKIDLAEADVIEEGGREAEAQGNDRSMAQESTGTCSISFAGFLFRAVAAYAQDRDSNRPLDGLASSMAGAAVGTVAEALRRCEDHFKRAARDMENTERVLKDIGNYDENDAERFMEWIRAKREKALER